MKEGGHPSNSIEGREGERENARARAVDKTKTHGSVSKGGERD
jgi:hypothetical protein